MNKTINLYKSNPATFTKLWFLALAVSMIIVSLLVNTPSEIIHGLSIIITSPDRLITDYVELANFGAAFTNAAILIFISVFLVHIFHAKINGLGIAAIFLMAGFGLFGKNIINIWGILIGVYLFSKFEREPFSKYIYVAFFGTSLAPISTELVLWHADLSMSYLFAFTLTILIGFFLPSIANKTITVHQGYNLYNVGFAAGLLAVIVAALMTSFGYDGKPILIWYDKFNPIIVFYLYFLFISFIILGFSLNHTSIKTYSLVLKQTGRLISDYYTSFGFAVVLINMGLLGITYTSYLLIIGGQINGPTIGALFTILGFSAFGKHLKNAIPITIGVILGAAVNIWSINDPAVLLGSLFASGLAPIAGQYGPIAGIVAGFIHLSLVISVGGIHGGMNLYNNGFSAGLVALVLIPILESFKQRRAK